MKFVLLLAEELGDTCLINGHASDIGSPQLMVEANLSPVQGLRLEGWFQAGRKPITGVYRARVPVGDIDAICRDEMRRHITPLRMVSAGSPCWGQHGGGRSSANRNRLSAWGVRLKGVSGQVRLDPFTRVCGWQVEQTSRRESVKQTARRTAKALGHPSDPWEGQPGDQAQECIPGGRTL